MKKIIVLFLISSMLLASCQINDIQNQDANATQSIDGYLEPRQTQKTYMGLATYTPWPTVSSLKLEKIVILLNDRNCSLPCYLGITPGVTYLKDAMSILDKIGGTLLSNYYRESDKTNNYTYSLKIGFSNSGNNTSNPYITSTDIHHDVTLITRNEIVQIVEVSVSAAKSVPILHDYWSRYFPVNIMKELGQPESIYIGYQDPKMSYIGRSMVIDYKNQGIDIEYFGTEKENNICFNKEAVHIDLIFHLFDVNTDINVFTNGGVPYSDRHSWIPIEDNIGITSNEFYSKVLDNPAICFTPLK